jgi:LMBR1 domain-containing protein 1
VPLPGDKTKHPLDFDYFKKLLTENRGERALTFALGLLTTLGTVLYILYTSTGLAFLPVSMIKSAPGISSPTLIANTQQALEHNRERQHQLELRNEGRTGGLSPSDRRELDKLVREEAILVRRERLAEEARGSGQGTVTKIWLKTKVIFRPFSLIGGFLILIVALFVAVSMLITGIDKAKNSICKARCGYIIANINIFNPVNWLLLQSSKAFPADYILVTLLVFLLFSSSVVGLSSIGIRFLWIKLLSIRKGKTSPQALLVSTVMLALMVLAIQFSLATTIAPQYATYGSQTYCSLDPKSAKDQPECLIPEQQDLIKPCSELSKDVSARNVCTPTVMTTFINRITSNFPFFGIVCFWAQFVFIGLYLILAITAIFRTPKLDMDEIDRDAEEDEEEGLLGSTNRRLGATWEDITGRAADDE